MQSIGLIQREREGRRERKIETVRGWREKEGKRERKRERERGDNVRESKRERGEKERKKAA